MRAILTYHSIDPSGSPISIDAPTFERHVAWLAGGSVEVLSLDELFSRRGGGDAIALTFDDGFTNFATEAWPRLRERGLPATVYVVSDLVGGTNSWEKAGGSLPVQPLCDWKTLGRLAEEGVAIGVHGRSHISLAGLEPERLEEEVVAAKERVESETGRATTSFAYPFGDHDAAAVGCVGRVFASACTTRMRLLATSDEPHLLPRLDAYYFRTPGRLESWGGLGFRAYVRARALAREVRLRALGLAAR